MSEQLKPCPFCGGEAVFAIHGKVCDIRCTRCSACTLFVECESYERIVNDWNTRNERTCHDIKTEEGISFHCSECDCVVLLDEVGESGIMADGVISPNYCPNCGAKVVDE